MKHNKSTLKVHFIGICGVSMSSLATYLASLGFTVTGSDLIKSDISAMLEKSGCKVFYGHKKENLQGVQVVVYNDAISFNNEELIYAKQEGLYLLKRAELLSMIAENFKVVIGVGGCHGKTTTTCMLSHILNASGKGFFAHIGGFDNSFGNCVIKGSEYMISEVCEFKKNLNYFNADYAVCLSSDTDHLDCYNGESELTDTYKNYLLRAEKSFICTEDKNYGKLKGENTVSYGVNETADYTAKELTEKNGKYSFIVYKGDRKLLKLKLGVVGYYNAINATCCVAVANELNIPLNAIKRGIESFNGVKRRFETVGKINGALIVCDYCHHPEEIRATVDTAKKIYKGRIFICFQPHTYSRTLFLKNEFIDLFKNYENLVLFKTFPARESYIKGGSAYDLSTELKNAKYEDDVDKLKEYYKKTLKKGDVLLVLGAGDLYFSFKN